ncbi:DUF4192 family protein [Arthrobacter sp. CAU 1506]|uniref:DUF4192 domain-containing protein n=1 Tax=Arthrobacter sp. CAU 1506 TaxID=2560052 RepID=UPI0010ACB76C|nr:DUF4192 domain-containing protein [Arthrobacter sp. CAU 1506]TJY70758.1 DUF4192 family protein [Arthrobacter sp. CAU 1506]
MEKKRFTARQSADVLGFVPHTLGFLPAESVVLLSLSGGRLGATLRLDLPRTGNNRQLELFADTAADYLRSDEEADSSLLILYTQHAWRAADRPPHPELVAALGRSLAAAGLPVRGGWAVGTEHWRELYCADASCCPLPGRPVSQIRDSALNAELVYNGSTYAASAAEAAVDPFPAAPRGEHPAAGSALEARGSEAPPGVAAPPASATSSAIQREADQLADGLAGSWTHPVFYYATLRRWEHALTANQSGTITAQAQAFLLASLTDNAVRDAIAIFACNGLEAAFLWAGAAGLLEGPDPGADVDPDVASLPEADDPAAARNLSRILVGDSPGAPDWERVDATAQLLGQLHSVGTGRSRAAAGALHAWIEWARGRGSHAHQRAEGCLREHPGYRLAELVRELADSGMLPLWARRRETAWPGPRHLAA